MIIVGNVPGVIGSNILNDFCRWKSLKGLKTKVVTVTQTGNTDSDIRRFINDEYVNYGINYVLLIGDQQCLPIHSMQQFADTSDTMLSDYWYGCMDGDSDYQADVAVGRFSVNTLTELENAMTKAMAYETGDNANGNYVVLMAHKEYAPSKYQQCLESIRNGHSDSVFDFITVYGASSAYGGDDATNDDIIDYINQGINILNYRGHGAVTYWGGNWCNSSYPNSSFRVNDIEGLNNTIYPVVFSIACNTADISYEDCLMERFMNGVHGAATCLGATVPSYTYPNHNYNKYLFDNLCDNQIYDIGFLNILSHMDNFAYYSSSPSTAKDNAFMYLCLGDPSLELWTGAINTVNEPTINVSNSSININLGNLSDYKVYVVSETGELLNRYHTYSSQCTISRPTTQCTISICKHNYKPYIIDCILGNYIQNKSIARHTINISTPVSVGYNVNPNASSGNVTIENGAILQLRKDSGVSICNGFECKARGKFIIK